MVKMMKRFVLLLAIMVLIPCGALAGNMVVDQAGLFSNAEIQQMEAIITSIRETYQIDAVVLTSNQVGYNNTQDYADLFYENGGYGIGEDDAGILYLIDMDNRVPCISTTGVMIDYITDYRLEELLDCGYDELTRGDYGGSALAVLSRVEDFLREGRQEGSFRYDAQTGQRLSGLYNKLTAGEMLLGAVAGLVVSLVMFSSVNGSYNLKGNGRARTGGVADCTLTKDEEVFLRQNVVRTRRPTNTGGGSSGGRSGGMGSSVHRSSSGMSHGGGVGRKF